MKEEEGRRNHPETSKRDHFFLVQKRSVSDAALVKEKRRPLLPPGEFNRCWVEGRGVNTFTGKVSYFKSGGRCKASEQSGRRSLFPLGTNRYKPKKG